MTSPLPGLLFLVPFTGAVLCVLCGPRLAHGVWGVAAAFMTGTVALVIGVAGMVVREGALHLPMGGWPPPLGIEWVLDRWRLLAVGMLALVSWATLLGVRRAVAVELPGREPFFYGSALLLISGLMGMVMTADLFNLFVHLELSALCAYALTAAGGHGAPQAAFRYLIVGSLGASCYLLGVGFLYAAVGSLHMADLAAQLSNAPPKLIAISLASIGVGMGVKMGLFPLHGWMPAAYGRTSTASAALLMPIATKATGFAFIMVMVHVYGRIPLPGVRTFLEALAWAGAAAMLAGGTFALAQRDVRRVFVYSSVSQMGLVALGIGMAHELGLLGAMVHLVSDALAKGALLLASGAAALNLGVRRIEELRRLRGRAPWVAAAWTVAGLSLIGIPPLGGFFGKWYVLLAAWSEKRWLWVGMIALGSVLTAVYVFRMLEPLWLSSHTEPEGPRPSMGVFMTTTAVLLALAGAAFGLGNAVLMRELLLPNLLGPLWPKP